MYYILESEATRGIVYCVGHAGRPQPSHTHIATSNSNIFDRRPATTTGDKQQIHFTT